MSDEKPTKKTFGSTGTNKPVEVRGIMAKHESKAKTGRKPIADDQKKKPISIYLTQAERETAQSKAGRVKLSVHITDFLHKKGYFD